MLQHFILCLLQSKIGSYHNKIRKEVYTQFIEIIHAQNLFRAS